MFNSGQEAKEYLVSRIVDEAEREGVSLSKTERKMMYFTESAWTLPDMDEVNEVFERDYDQSKYEEKIGALARRARAQKDGHSEWKEALRVLKREDHYLLLLLVETRTGPTDSVLADRLKLIVSSLLICLLLLAGMLIFATQK